MLKDLNRPSGLYGEVYDRQTNAKSKRSTQQYQPFAQWESQVVEIVLDELKKNLNLK